MEKDTSEKHYKGTMEKDTSEKHYKGTMEKDTSEKNHKGTMEKDTTESTTKGSMEKDTSDESTPVNKHFLDIFKIGPLSFDFKNKGEKELTTEELEEKTRQEKETGFRKAWEILHLTSRPKPDQIKIELEKKKKKILPIEPFNSYGAMLQSLVHPIHHDPRILYVICQDNFSGLKECFSIDQDYHNSLLSNALESSKNNKLVLQSLKEMSRSHPIYTRDKFSTDSSFESWKRQYEHTIDHDLLYLKDHPEDYAGILYIKVIAGRNLAIRDYDTGLSDPYCVIKVGNDQFKTERIERTLNPVWHEEFVVKLDSLPKPGETLKVAVYDWDQLSFDDGIGKVKIPIDVLLDYTPRDEWLLLKEFSVTDSRALKKDPLGQAQTLGKKIFLRGGKKEELGEVRIAVHFTANSMRIQKVGHNKTIAKGVIKKYILGPLNDIHHHKKDHKRENDIAMIETEINTSNSVSEMAVRASEGYYSDILKSLLVNPPEAFKTNLGQSESKPIDYPFNKFTKWILQEVASSYGISDTFISFAIYELLLEYLDNYPPFCAHLSPLLESLSSFLTIFTTEQHERFKDLVSRTRSLLLDMIGCYHTCFADSDTIKYALTLLKKVEEYNIAPLLRSTVVTAINKQFDKMEKASAGNTIALVDAINLAIIEDRDTFSEAFAEYFNLLEVSIPIYSNFLVTLMDKEIELGLSSSDGNKVIPSLRFAFKLKDIFKNFRENLKDSETQKDLPKVTVVDQKFHPIMDIWFNSSKERLLLLTKGSIDLEKWEPVSKNEPSHSASLPDVPQILFQTLDFLVSLNLDCEHFIIKFVRSTISSVVFNYVKLVKKTLFLYLAPFFSEENKNSESDFIQTLPPQVFTLLNNLHTMRSVLQDIEKKVETIIKQFTELSIQDDRFSDAFYQLFKNTRQSLEEAIDAVLHVINGPLLLGMSSFIQRVTKKEDNKTFYDLLNTSIEQFSQNCMFPVFIKILHGLWRILLKDMEMFLFPLPLFNSYQTATSVESNIMSNMVSSFSSSHHHKDPSTIAWTVETSKTVRNELKQLKVLLWKDFFEADGEGISSKRLSRDSQTILKACDLAELSQEDLIQICLKGGEGIGHYKHHALAILQRSKGQSKNIDSFLNDFPLIVLPQTVEACIITANNSFISNMMNPETPGICLKLGKQLALLPLSELAARAYSSGKLKRVPENLKSEFHPPNILFSLLFPGFETVLIDTVVKLKKEMGLKIRSDPHFIEEMTMKMEQDMHLTSVKIKTAGKKMKHGTKVMLSSMKKKFKGTATTQEQPQSDFFNHIDMNLRNRTPLIEGDLFRQSSIIKKLKKVYVVCFSQPREFCVWDMVPPATKKDSQHIQHCHYRLHCSASGSITIRTIGGIHYMAIKEDNHHNVKTFIIPAPDFEKWESFQKQQEFLAD